MIKYKLTTTVPPEKTAGEIMGLLCELGATDISHQIESGEMVGMRFGVEFEGDQKLAYEMPIRWRAIFETLKAERLKKAKNAPRDGWEEKLEQQARWAAWRIALEWLKVQMSFVETGARDPREVFLADMIVNKKGETVGQLALAGKLPKLLTGGE